MQECRISIPGYVESLPSLLWLRETPGCCYQHEPYSEKETLSLLSEPLQLSAYECTPIKYSFGIPLTSFPLSGQPSPESPSNSACYALNPQEQGFGGEETLLCSPLL